jgi:hypothetical protein
MSWLLELGELLSKHATYDTDKKMWHSTVTVIPQESDGNE